MSLSKQSADAISSSIKQLACPLEVHMLPLLHLNHLAALRAACSASLQLVDQAPADVFRQAASSALPQALLLQPHDSLSLQRMLRAQAQTLKRFQADLVVTSPDIRPIKPPAMMFDVDYGFTKLWWSPLPPTDLLVARHRNMFQHFLQVIAWNQELRTWQVLSQFSQLRALAWCMPAQHLVCHSTGPDWGTLVLLDPYEGSLASSSLLVYHPDDPIISPRGDYIIVGINERDLAVCRLPALTIAWYLAHPGMQLAVADTSDRSWIAWAPTGQYLAMVGRRAGAHVSMAPVSRLRICAASDGTELASFNSWHQCWPGLAMLQTQELRLTWAPSGDCIAIHHYHLTDVLVTSLRSVILVDCTGSHWVFEGLTVWLAASATWSSCGRYLMIDGKTAAGVVKCAVWDTATEVQIWRWDGTDPTAFAWAPAGCTLLAWQAPSRHAKLYSKGLQALSCPCSAPPEVSTSTLWGHSSDQKLAGLQFSPCGNLIIVSIKSQNVTSGRTSQLCHVECGPEGDLRKLIHVADLISPAVPSASAWHPSPRVPFLYAIACEDFSVHLIDGCSHCCLSSWHLDGDAPQAGYKDPGWSGPVDITLDWSNDGHSLAMLLQGFIWIVAFS